MSDHTCTACGETFSTLTKLRLHEKDDCLGLEQYDEFDPGSENVGQQGAKGLLTCRHCDQLNPNANYDETPSFVDGEYHLIVEFTCNFCGAENNSRIVLTSIDRDDLDGLPPHLQPEESEVIG